MPKIFPGNVATQAARQFGPEPLIIVGVDWGAGLKYYCDRSFGPAEGTLLEFSGLQTIVKITGSGSAASASCKLSDTDGYIRGILGTKDIHKRPVYVYLAYGDLTFADKFLLFRGELNSPTEWDDASRTFSFDIVSSIEKAEVGFSPEQADLTFVDEDAVGKAWPLCFGSPLHVPAAKITSQVQGTTLFQYRAISAASVVQVCSLAKQQREYLNLRNAADTPLAYLVGEASYVDILESLNSATTSLVQALESMLSGGTPAQRTLANSLVVACGDLREAELLKESADAGASSAGAAVDAADASLITLNEQLADANAESPLIPEKIEAIEAAIAAVETSRDAAITAEAFYQNQSATAASNITIAEAEAAAIESALIQVNIPTILVKGGENFPQGVKTTIIIQGLRFSGTFAGETFTVNGYPTSLNPDAFGEAEDFGVVTLGVNQFTSSIDVKGMYSWHGVGLVYINNWEGGIATYTPALYRKTGTVSFGATTRDTYDFRTLSGPGQVSPVVDPTWLQALRSLDASGTVPDFASGLSKIQYSELNINYGDQVFKEGNFQEKYVANLIESTAIHEVMAYRNVDGVQTLVPVPTSYYVVNLAEELAGQTCTTITLKQPLESYNDEGWTPGLYVSLTSTEGPNTSDVLRFLVEEYSSDLTVDTASFDALATALADYPSHFALLEKKNLVTALEEISWQARSAAYVRNDVVFVKYLAAEEAAVVELSDANIDFETLKLTLTDTEDLVTVFKALWKKEYTQEEDSSVTIRNNIPIYGTLEEEYDFYIYNIESLVVKSATFWSIRYSNTWKKALLSARPSTLELDEFDTVSVNVGENIFATAPVKGVVESVTYDSSDYTVTFEIWLSVRSGTLETYVFAWPATAAPGEIYPTEIDLYTGSNQ